MENKSHALAAGSFVLALLLMLGGLAWWLMRDKGSYHVWEMSTADSIAGLQVQAPVRYRGVAVGKVARIGFDPEASGHVLIRITVEDDTPLSNKTFATLSYQGVTGLAYVLLDEAEQPHEPLPPSPDGVPRLPLDTSQLSKLTQEIPEVMAQVTDATRRVNQLLSDDNQKRVSRALDNIGTAASRLAELSTTLDHTVQTQLDPALASVPGVAQSATRTLQSVQNTVTQMGALTADMQQTLRRINEPQGVLDSLAQTSGQLLLTTQAVQAQTLPRLNRVSDDAAHAAQQVGRLANDVREQPQALLFGRGPTPPGPGEAGFVAPAPSTPR
ncbi:MAG: MCE family protein [Burkholderiaceae bacterium]|nr:MCE family protein [Roseateles sp.]MBV8470090.1 MCE family protein [Burkholderiaceae bacterium]